MIRFGTFVQKAWKMDRRFKILVVSALAALAPLMAGCTPDSPDTELSWNANDHRGHREPAVQYASRDTAKTYVYEGDAYAVPAPKARPQPREDDTPAYQPSAYTHRSDRSDANFEWPVNGRVLSGFGTTTNGERNDGINIAVPRGTPIHAAETGTVTYAGDGLKDYGNLLLLKHQGGYVTAYAHADRLIVHQGEAVTKGQVIGYSGSTGDVSSPQLHFEVRRDTTPVDPRGFLVARNS
jgi:murein DD-endopeptidase MepM/ murein hydrolase activator NlpD